MYMMAQKILIVPKVRSWEQALTADGIMREGDSLDNRNWVDAGEVSVRFLICHDGSDIFLQYFVEEPQVRATHTRFNDPVHEDSCVEFFIAFQGEQERYYNFEFNCIGTMLGGYGKSRQERDRFSEEVLRQITTFPSLGKKPFGLREGPVIWKLSIRLPAGVFIHSGIDDLTGRQASANFYKCGDRLDNPHYLSWAAVNTPKPDFHQPRYFGKLVFR